MRRKLRNASNGSKIPWTDEHSRSVEVRVSPRDGKNGKQ